MDMIRNTLFSNFSTDFAVSQHGFVITDATWRQPPLPSPYSRLYFVMDGAGMLLAEQEQMALEGGYAYLAPCGLACGFRGDDSVTKLYFHINILLPDGYDLFLKAKHFARIAYPMEQMEQLREYYLSKDPVKHILLKAAIWEILARFAKDILPNNTREERYSVRTAQALAYIHSHLSASLTVKEVAEAQFCSETTLGMSFRSEIGLTVGRYIEDMVFFEAQQLLLNTEHSIGEISAMLGFSDQFYFSRRFRKLFSVSPRSYRGLHL